MLIKPGVSVIKEKRGCRKKVAEVDLVLSPFLISFLKKMRDKWVAEGITLFSFYKTKMKNKMYLVDDFCLLAK